VCIGLGGIAYHHFFSRFHDGICCFFGGGDDGIQFLASAGKLFALNFTGLEFCDLRPGLRDVRRKLLHFFVQGHVDGAEVPLHDGNQYLGHTGHVGKTHLVLIFFPKNIYQSANANIQCIDINCVHGFVPDAS
jgi:hypothetical protein